jgi:hypothetical protein
LIRVHFQASGLANLQTVRKSLIRRLDALGYAFLNPLRLGGIGASVFYLDDRNWVIIESHWLGLSWAQVFSSLEETGLDPVLMSVGDRKLIKALDSREVRGVLESLSKAARDDRIRLVHIPGIGFEPTSQPRTFSFLGLLGPAIALVATVAVSGSLSIGSQEIVSGEQQEPPSIAPSCVLELGEQEGEKWLMQELAARGEELAAETVLISSNLGSASVSVLDSVGSTVLIRAEIACSNGLASVQLFRADRSLSGKFVKLKAD